MTDTELAHCHQQAYAAFDHGHLQEAASLFARLQAQEPGDASYHYMAGLVAKYQRRWADSLRHNQQAIALRDEFDEASHWNAAIAATALGHWALARQLWAACGITLTAGQGPDSPPEDDFGLAVLRLNPWDAAETVYARRIDPVRARILNVPLPESGYAFGDTVLHDGAPTGSRPDGRGGEVMVFNALARLQPSPLASFIALINCPGPADVQALQAAAVAAAGFAEDWGSSLRLLCRRCSYGVPHQHAPAAPAEDPAWDPERDIGLALPSRAVAERVLHTWASAAPGRYLQGLHTESHPMPAPPDGLNWWDNIAQA